MNYIRNSARLLISGCYVGYLPAPGTCMSLLTALLWIYFPSAQTMLMIVGVTIVACVGIWLARPTDHDPAWIVMDEMVGMLIACYGIPVEYCYVILAFILFRINDIIKWGPIKWLERLANPWGIVADDMLAGLVANGIIRIAWLYVA